MIAPDILVVAPAPLTSLPTADLLRAEQTSPRLDVATKRYIDHLSNGRFYLAHLCLWTVSSDYAMRWLVFATAFLTGAIWLLIDGVPIDLVSIWLITKPITIILVGTQVLRSLGRRLSQDGFRKFVVVLEDFFCSAAQMLAVGAVSGLAMYLAARAGARFPLRDDTLAYADHMLGFDWDAVVHWIRGFPLLHDVLLQTYFTAMPQGGIVLLLGSALHPGDRNREFIWTVAVGVMLTAAVFAFVPAIGKVGSWDTDFIDRLMEIRAGTSSMSWSRTASLVSFPSFHTVTAVLVTYAARQRRWSLILAMLVNAVMLAAIPPIGGHYLVDVFGGLAVAVLAIALVHYFPIRNVGTRPWRAEYAGGRGT